MPAENPLTTTTLPLSLYKCLGIASGVFLIAAVVLYRTALQYDASSHWPTTKGVVSANGLKVDFQKGNSEPWFTPTVVYSYKADGVPRIGSRVAFEDGNSAFRKNDALAWLASNYPVGRTVTVYYDAADADNAVLTPGAPEYVFIARWAVATMAICCVVSFILHFRARLKALPEFEFCGAATRHHGWGT